MADPSVRDDPEDDLGRRRLVAARLRVEDSAHARRVRTLAVASQKRPREGLRSREVAAPLGGLDTEHAGFDAERPILAELGVVAIERSERLPCSARAQRLARSIERCN